MSLPLAPAPYDPRYPIGPEKPHDRTIYPEERPEAILVLADLPAQLRKAVEGLDPHQLATPYREGGWTLRQVVHHVGDSHMNAFIRVRLALTEDWPAIKPYNEAEWSKLRDSEAPLSWSLDLVEGLHARWVMLLRSLTEEQWQRGFIHAERGRTSVELATLEYAWHSRHHVAHITHLREDRGW